MKNVNFKTVFFASLLFAGLFATSCKDNHKENDGNATESEASQADGPMDEEEGMDSGSGASSNTSDTTNTTGTDARNSDTMNGSGTGAQPTVPGGTATGSGTGGTSSGRQ